MRLGVVEGVMDGMLVEVHWLNVVLVIETMVELVVRLMVCMVSDGLMVVIVMTLDLMGESISVMVRVVNGVEMVSMLLCIFVVRLLMLVTKVVQVHRCVVNLRFILILLMSSHVMGGSLMMRFLLMVRMGVAVIESLVDSVLMEVDWLNIVLVVKTMVELVVSLVVLMVRNGFMVVIVMVDNGLLIVSFVVDGLVMDGLVMDGFVMTVLNLVMRLFMAVRALNMVTLFMARLMMHLSDVLTIVMFAAVLVVRLLLVMSIADLPLILLSAVSIIVIVVMAKAVIHFEWGDFLIEMADKFMAKSFLMVLNVSYLGVLWSLITGPVVFWLVFVLLVADGLVLMLELVIVAHDQVAIIM